MSAVNNTKVLVRISSEKHMEKSFVFFLGVTYGKRIIFGVSNIWQRMIFQQIMLERILFSAFLNVPIFYLSTDIVDILRCT